MYVCRGSEFRGSNPFDKTARIYGSITIFQNVAPIEPMRAHFLLACLSICFAQDTPESKSEAVKIPVLRQSVVITATPVEPTIDRRNAEIFERTLFSRDDQIFHVLDAGINA